MKYEYNGKTYDGIDDVISAVADDICDDRYQADWIEYINDMMGDVEICGLEYGQGTALHDLDPIAFHEMCQEETDIIVNELQGDLDKLKNGELVRVPIMGTAIVATVSRSE